MDQFNPKFHSTPPISFSHSTFFPTASSPPQQPPPPSMGFVDDMFSHLITTPPSTLDSFLQDIKAHLTPLHLPSHDQLHDHSELLNTPNSSSISSSSTENTAPPHANYANHLNTKFSQEEDDNGGLEQDNPPKRTHKQ